MKTCPFRIFFPLVWALFIHLGGFAGGLIPWSFLSCEAELYYYQGSFLFYTPEHGFVKSQGLASGHVSFHALLFHQPLSSILVGICGPD